MHRIIITLTVVCTLGAGIDNGLEMHVWRGEYARAIDSASNVPETARATYLMMAGRVDEASRVAAGPSDPFRAGSIAFKAGRYDEALKALEDDVADRYLETYRRFMRGSSLHRLGFHEEAAAELDTLFAGIVGDPDLDDHPVLSDAEDEYVEILAEDPTAGTPFTVGGARGTALSGASRFLLACIHLNGGRPGEGERWFFLGLRARADTAAFFHFERAAALLAPRFETYGRERLLSVADYALRRAESEVTREIIDRLRASYPGDPAVRLREAGYEAGLGHVERAVSIARSVFESNAPVDLKKEALHQAASFEYRLGRLGASAESYRIFGMYYPDDDRSDHSLDLAARIEVARGEAARALVIWRALRDRGLRSRTARCAALSEAVLRYRRGSTHEARTILRRLLAGSRDETRAAALYWLHRAAPTREAARRWKERLLLEFPHSFYAAVAEQGEAFLHAPLDVRGASAPRGILEAMERREREIFETIRPERPPGDSVLAHPAHRAYTYFLSIGMLDEASACAETLLRRFGGNRSVMASLYRDARENGMIDLALAVAYTPAFLSRDRDMPASLHYPIGYTGAIAEVAAERLLPATLVLSVIREESRFDPRAVSRVGAVGLMQLMPATGAWLAEKLGVPDYSDRNLIEPSFSITAGTYYLGSLLKRYDGSITAALAAYNAGDGRIASWNRRFEPTKHPMIAIEMIGVRETREYVKRVLNSMAAYQAVYADRSRDES